MAEERTALCRRNSWIVAAAFGALIAIMLVAFAGHGVLKAILIGLVLGVLLGLFLLWAFCGRSHAAGETLASRADDDARPSGAAGKP